MTAPSRSRTSAVAWAIVAATSGALLALSSPSCTTFSGVVFDGGSDTTSADSSSTSTGSSGSGGHADGGPKPETYLSQSDAAKLCSRLMSCSEPELAESLIAGAGVPLDPSNFSTCMTWAAGPIPPDRPGISFQRLVLKCAVDAKDCTAAAACSSEEILTADDPRCEDADAGAGGAGAGESCAGTKDVLRCGDTNLGVVSSALHCDNPFYYQSTCEKDTTDGSLWCTASADCGGADTCIGTVVEYCSDNLKFAINCAVTGNECGNDPKEGFDCLTDGKYEGCTGYASKCDGTTVKTCNTGNYSAFHCAKLGATCDASANTPYCHKPSDVCTPSDPEVNTCSGSKLKLCLAGQRVEFDCSTIGLQCQSSPLGTCK